MSVAGKRVWLPWYCRLIQHNADMNSSTGALEGGNLYTVLPKLYKEGNFPDRVMYQSQTSNQRISEPQELIN
jgi:hypothetical protein